MTKNEVRKHYFHPYEIRVNGESIRYAATEGEARRFASRFTHATAHVFRNGELIAEYGGRGKA